MMKNKKEVDIDSLKNQRQLNVQEQFAIKKERILSEAMYWRTNGIPSPLQSIFKEKGIDMEKSIFLEYEQDFPGLSTDEGIIVTPDGNFFEFEADLNEERTKLLELYSFKNVSERFEINGHKKGIGKTFGFLAIEVLNEINKKYQTVIIGNTIISN
jgi:hypothetical protein